MSEKMKLYDMQDDDVRRQVFWMLKRLSSYALWKRKRDAWEVFAYAYEAAVSNWPKSRPEQMDPDMLPRIFEVLSLYNEGVQELAKGHRFVWRVDGPLALAIDKAGTISRYFYTDPDYWERGMQLAPYPPPVEALHKLMRASEFNGEYAPTEVPDAPHMTARCPSPGSLLNPDAYKFAFYDLPYPVFPAGLPEVPVGTDLIVRSGQRVPKDGIWEPVRVEREKAFGIVPVGVKKAENNGCFNYLVADGKAPYVAEWDEAHARTERVATYWRLLWEDFRYKDGAIPDESEYFIEAKVSSVLPAEGQRAEEVEVRTGDPCPVTGTWEATDFDNHRIEASQGMVMPDVLASAAGSGERRVHWVTWRLVRRA
ncbi:Imm72 family immunity protein [Paraburkholderia strydomiana]|uniref:Imm72 family immunity protein n=1 Tax=Paraburkholderia strydomiana TaxID=1245417 RepID=UPI0038B98C60